MRKLIYLFIFFFSLVNTKLMANEIMILKLTYGDVEIELYPDKAPNHVKRFKELELFLLSVWVPTTPSTIAGSYTRLKPRNREF